MKIIGLTGGIGTGKSTVSDYLKQKDCIILDADAISRAMTAKGAPALEDIKKTFGEKYILEDGSLDRKALGNLVFNNKKLQNLLQQIITQKVVEDINEKIAELKERNCQNIVVIDAPLLFECGMFDIADENWLVSAELSVRLKRIAARDNLSEEEIMWRINSQMSQEEKEKYSQCIIDNSGSIANLYSQIDRQLERIKDEI